MLEWSEALSGLTAEEIKRGIKALKKTEKWPPSIAEFLDSCRGNWEQSGPAYRVSAPALPKPKANKIIVAQNLAKIREATTRK